MEWGRQIEQTLIGTTHQPSRLKYLLFLPRDYERQAAKWPLILFLHGAGERGCGELEKLKQHGPPKLVETQPDFPFIVVSPQCPPEANWADDDLQRLLPQLLQETIEKFDVDEDRVYLTGMSMGGFGAWKLAASHPECFAAVVPICGGGDPSWAESLCDLPIWAFHGDLDDVVPASYSRQMVDAIRAHGGPVEFTAYPELGHDAWTTTYENRELYEWLLSHTRAERQHVWR